VDRYSFTVTDFHHLPPADLPGAPQLNISPKTVENHRAWVMERIGAKNLANLVRLALKIEERS
jgi:hypothetical protein